MSCTGQLGTVTPSGCPAGSQISWGDGLVTAPDNVRDFTVKQATTLKATCTTPYQIKAMAEIAISETKPELSVSPLVVYKGFPATLSAFGCYTSDCREGAYSWKKHRSSEPAQTGSSIRVNLTGPTDYDLTCNQVTKRVTIETKELDCDFSIAPNYRSTGTATLIADQCDVDRRMSWIFLENSNGVGTPYADDVSTITVSCPATTANGYVDTYVVNCFKDGVPCKGVAFVRAPTTGGTNEGGSNPFPPGDACEGLSGDETKTAESPNYTWYLYSSWCPGRVSWYGDAARTKLVAALLKGERYSVGQIKTAVTYYYDCSLRDGTLCQGSATLKPAASKGRVGAAEVAACSPAVKTNTCSGQISLAVASAVFYEKMLCQLSNLVQTREDAIALLSSLQSQLSGTGLIFPADLTEVADVLVGGQCEQAAKLLAGANGNSLIDNPTFNEQINSQFGDIEESLLAKYKPFLIAQSVHRKGRNNDNTSSAADLAYCDMSPSQMIPINPEVSDWLQESDDKLFANLLSMVKKYTFGNLEEVVVSMVNRFKLSSGGEYSNPTLTDRAKNHESTQLFIKRLQKNLELKLSVDKGFFRKKEQLHYLVDENSISPNINRPDIPSPTYHTLYDFTHGLTLAVNDTWGYDVTISDYIISGNSYSAKLDITIFDHFGLDTPDICNPCSNGEDPKWFAEWDGFVSWYILQHRQNRCYKPFITIIRFPQIISGTF